MRTTFETPSGMLFGAAYYPEYRQASPAEIDVDLGLMAEAGFTVIRVGESVWTTWEPRPGEFDLEWITPVLDAAARHGIGVILGTPTYAIPPWLFEAHPELAVERADGQRVPWGGRQEVDFTHPTFRRLAERMIREILGRHAAHSAVIGFQVDNEPGLHLIHNAHVVERFIGELSAEYETPDRLSDEWGLTYWSHRITEWSQLWHPGGNTFPQYDLAWRRFQASLTTEFIGWQADIVREYKSTDQFVTTCLAYPRGAVEDEPLGRGLDIAAGNAYYSAQDHLSTGRELRSIDTWITTGPAGLVRQADRMYSTKQARFLVTETNAQSIGFSHQNYPPYPGQLGLAAMTLIARGAQMIEYWNWDTLRSGAETHWGGVLPHSRVPGRVYEELSLVGAHLKAWGDSLDGYEPDGDVAFLWSSPSRWALEFEPPLRDADGRPEAASYIEIFDAFHSAVFSAGLQSRVLHVSQAIALDPREMVGRYPVLVVAGAYVLGDDALQWLRDYAAAGGHLIVGPRTGYADEQARARMEISPPGLADLAGAWYEESMNLDAPVALRAGLPVESGKARRWADGLRVRGGDTLASYDHPELARFAAATTRAQPGGGRVTLVGTLPDEDLGRALFAWVVPSPLAGRWEAPESVHVASGRCAGGRRAVFLLNFGGAPAQVVVPEGGFVEPTTRSHLRAGDIIRLAPWGATAMFSESFTTKREQS